MEPGVVVGYDQTPSSERAIDEAAAEAASRGVGLTVVHASHHGLAASMHHEPLPHAESSSPYTGRDVAELGAERARGENPGLSVRALSVAGSVPTTLAGFSSDADLLVVGHRGHGGFAGLRLGSVVLRTVTRACCPTVVVRGAGHGSRGTVLAAVDVGDPADEILGFAFAEAARRESRLKVVGALEILWPWAYAGDRGELGDASAQAVKRAAEALEGLLEPWRAEFPEIVVESELVEGAPAEILTGATTYADLIVVGARRRGEGHHRQGHHGDGNHGDGHHRDDHHGDGHHGMHLGPIAHTLLLHADCSVAVVPHS